jgi:virginiamycin B lyase
MDFEMGRGQTPLTLIAATVMVVVLASCRGQTHSEASVLSSPPASPTVRYANRSTYEHDEYLLPHSPRGPGGIVVGPDHALWFTETRVWFGIGRIDLHGHIAEFPTVTMRPSGPIILGPDNALWFAAGNTIGRITITGQVTSNAVPLATFDVTDLTVGPDKAIWFSGFADDGSTQEIGRIDEYGHPRFIMRVRGIPWAIITGADGAIWFTLDYPARLGRLTMDGKYRQFPVDVSPSTITATSDGKVWFTSSHTNTIGWVDRSGKTVLLPIPGDINPGPIIPGPGGMWYGGVNLLGRLAPDRTIINYWPKSPNSGAGGVVLGPDGAIWFTEYNSNAIGRIRLNPPY